MRISVQLLSRIRLFVTPQTWGRQESDTTEQLHFHFSLSCIGEGNGNPLQCSCLENPRDRGAWWAAFSGVAQSWTRLKRLRSSSRPFCDHSPFKCLLALKADHLQAATCFTEQHGWAWLEVRNGGQILNSKAPTTFLQRNSSVFHKTLWKWLSRWLQFISLEFSLLFFTFYSQLTAF